jgi:methionyl-tRNA formyltransferase
MTNNTICLAGDGWGAISAYNSLRAVFPNIELITNDDDLLRLKQKGHKRIHHFSESESEHVVCAGYKPIVLKNELLQRTFINVHYSLLPKYRGYHPVVWAILNNEEYLGLTVHLMNEYIDDGDIIEQYCIRNNKTDTSVFYMLHFNKWIENNLATVILKYLDKSTVPVKQDWNFATWMFKRNVEDCRIDFSKNHTYLKAFFRALVTPYPIPFIELKSNNERFTVTKASFIERNVAYTNFGKIVNIDNRGVYVSSKDGYVILQEMCDRNNHLVDNNIFKTGMYLIQK